MMCQPAGDTVVHPWMRACPSPNRTTPLLEARRLACQFDGRVLWREVDLTLAADERVGITGSSGSGKTVLLRTLAGLETVQGGALTLCGRAAHDWSMPAYRARVMYVSQRPTLREGSVEAALRGPFAFRAHRGRAFPLDRARRGLGALGRNPDFLNQRCERLSGGEAQLVALLRALLLEPQVLLLDEPTASMDPAAVAAAEVLVEAWLHAGPDRACVWTSHDRTQLRRTCDRLQAVGSAA